MTETETRLLLPCFPPLSPGYLGFTAPDTNTITSNIITNAATSSFPSLLQERTLKPCASRPPNYLFG